MGTVAKQDQAGQASWGLEGQGSGRGQVWGRGKEREGGRPEEEGHRQKEAQGGGPKTALAESAQAACCSRCQA